MTVSATSNVDKFNAALREYVATSRQDAAELVAKKSGDLVIALGKGMKLFTPAKGQVKEERLAALKAGGGIHIRRAALDYARRKTTSTATNVKNRKAALFMEKGRTGKLKTKNARSFTQLAVRFELGIRESGRFYLPLAVMFSGLKGKLKANEYGTKTQVTVDRMSRGIGRAEFKNSLNDTSLTLSWGDGNSATNAIARVLQKPAQESVIARALAEVRADMIEGIRIRRARAAKRFAGN